MYRHLMILPDGREIFSGVDKDPALRSVTVTHSVNSGQELTVGSACSAMLEVELLSGQGAFYLKTGEPITLYRVETDDSRHRIGVFYPEKPTRSSAHTMTLTAFDPVSRLDKDLTGWLLGLDQWPYPAGEFAAMVCGQCGLELAEGELPNGDFYIRGFSADRVTGRHLIQWLGQIFGRFCRANPEGKLEFAWYRPNEAVTVTPDGQSGSLYCLQNGLQYEDYQVAPVEMVQLRQTTEDIGTLWPDESGQKNTYVIENNPMLAAQSSETLQSVARTLYEQLSAVTYTPCTVTLPAAPEIAAGDILSVTDRNGRVLTAYIMQKKSDGQQDTLQCTGSPSRDSSIAVNNLQYQAHSGKLLNLRMDVEGLRAENRDATGKMALLELDVEGIRSRVEQQEASLQETVQSISSLTQTAQDLTVQIETVRDNGAEKVRTSRGYVFDDTGLHISHSDSDMENLLDHSGMCVRRGGQVLLSADNRGVEAVDVTVGNYLIIGDNSRLEDYGTGRTACFYRGKEDSYGD